MRLPTGLAVRVFACTALIAVSGVLLAEPVGAQAAPNAPPAAAPVDCLTRANPMQPPTAYVAVEQQPDSRVTFRLCAPAATTVKVTSPDMAAIPAGFPPGTPAGLALTKGDKGIWSGTTATPAVPGTYRYAFEVDGVRTPSPQGADFSEHLAGVSSIVEVHGPAGEFQSFNSAIPHGAIQTVRYWSKSLQAVRRAHIYTPPGYMSGVKRYPVLYLVNGAGDSDDSWTSVGHAHLILDNLIAAGKAVPMIIVMPAGHTPPRPVAAAAGALLNNRDFGNDLIKDLIPYVDANYRTLNRVDSRAMAGLSMGGAHTLNFGLPHPELFRYVGIFSMGLGLSMPGMSNANAIAEYEAANDAGLKQAARQMKLVYYAIGREDFLYSTVAPTRQMFQKYGIEPIYHESGGGHTWMNWRDYLADFAPRLFR
jgi:enterochelin esterase-like enzyme